MKKEAAKDFFTKAQEAELVNTIKEAELLTSGEIRVHLESHFEGDHFKHAKEVFEKAGMTNTELRNGVLFYLAVEDHNFVVLGDKGIHEKVGDDFWSNVRNEMQAEFREGNFVEGLKKGILTAGNALKESFPYQEDDQNELPDTLSKS
jgi:uncharacterized membrane protein